MVLTEELTIKFCEEIKKGTPIKYVCDLLWINTNTYQDWMEQGAYDNKIDADTIYNFFYKCVKQAYSEFLISCRKIIQAGDKGWQGSAWWLERTNKEFQMNNDTLITTENITINTKMRKKSKHE